MYNNTSEKGYAAIKKRWKTEEDKLKNNLLKLDKNTRYLLTARLCGYLAGDGSLCFRTEKDNGREHHDIRFYPDHKSLVSLFVNTFYRLYAKKPSVKELEKHYRIHVSCKFAYKDLSNLSNFGTMTWRLPRFIKTRKLQIEW